MFEKGFKASKCKSLLKLVIARIALVRNKRGAQIRQLRKDVAQILQSGQELSVRKRVDIIMKEQNILDAYALIEKFCELVLTRLAEIKAGKSCPLDTKEAISSLIFAGSRCADLPELLELRSIFEEHFGKQFIVAAAELQSDSGVNKVIIEKLSGRMVNEDSRVQLMKDIAAENRLQWSPKVPEIVYVVGLKNDQIENQKYSTGLVDKTSNVIKDEPNVESNVPTGSEAVFPAPHAAEIEQMQFIPFVSSSSPPLRSVKEQRQHIPFVPSVSRVSSPSTSSLEAQTLDGEMDVSNLNRQKTRQSTQGLRKEMDKELHTDNFSYHDLSFMQQRKPDQDGDSHMQGKKSLESGEGAKTDSWKASDKRMDVRIKATNKHPEKKIVNETEFHASQTPMTSIKTGSSGRDVRENFDRSSASADVLPSFKLQPKPERTEKVFENELQQTRSKPKVDLNWTSVKGSARISLDYENNLAQSDKPESITYETLIRNSILQGYQTSLQNQTEQSIRIVKHSLAATSSESDDDSMLIQRLSTRNARLTASSGSIKDDQETSSEDEPNLYPSVFRKPRLSSHAQESDVVLKGNRSGNARHKYHEKEALQDSSRVQRVYKSGENQSSNQETESNDNDTEDLVFSSLKKGVGDYPGRSKLREHNERADKGAYVSENTYYGRDEDSLHRSSSAKTFVQKIPVHFDGEDKSHFDEYNMHNLGEQGQRMKREQFHVAEKHKLDYEDDSQTRVGTQDSRRDYIGDNSTEKNEWLRSRTKHSGESGFRAADSGVSAYRREVVHGKLKWNSSFQEQEDTSSNSSIIQPLNAFDSHCEAEEVHSQDSAQKFPLRNMETAKVDKQEAVVNPSLVRSKRTTGKSVRSRLPGKTDESSKPKPVGQGGSVASDEYKEANDSNYPDTKYEQFICSELPADVNPNQCASFKPSSALYLPMSRPSDDTKDNSSSEGIDVHKTLRDQNSTRTPAELISAQHDSSRQTTATYLPPSRPRSEAKSTGHSGAYQEQKGSRDPSPLPRTQVKKIPVQYASSWQTSPSLLPTSQPGSKARESTSAEVSDVQKALSASPLSTRKQADSSPPQNSSTKLTSASNFPPPPSQNTKLQTEAGLSDNDLMARFQALKAQLY